MSTQTDLDAAKIARHNLITGKMAKVIVDQNGERVEFNSTNLKQLNAYIADLEKQLGIRTTTGPMRVFF